MLSIKISALYGDFYTQLTCKPGSVEDNHLSSHTCCQVDQADIGWHGRIALCVPATLQPTGFTSLPRHRG